VFWHVSVLRLSIDETGTVIYRGGQFGSGVPLIWAAGEGRVATIEVLLKAGANPRARDPSNQTALDRANGQCVEMASISARTPPGFMSPVTPDECRKIMTLLQTALAK